LQGDEAAVFHWDNDAEDVLLEYGATGDGTIFPASLCSSSWRELCSGYLLNIIFDCPYEMHEMLADHFLSKMVLE